MTFKNVMLLACLGREEKSGNGPEADVVVTEPTNIPCEPFPVPHLGRTSARPGHDAMNRV